MKEQFSRTEMLIGEDAINMLSQKRVAVFGIGGVGGYVVEALARTGIGAIDLIDNDVVSLSNINRQIIATHSTVGKLKTEVAKERALDINPNIKIQTFNMFFTPETSNEIDFTQYDYVVDAIDTVSGKIELVMKCNELNIPIISSMGAGNKLDPTLFEVSDIYKTSVCPLAKAMRTELKKRGIKNLKVVYSKEMPVKQPQDGKRVPASIAFVPSVVGLIISSVVIKDLIK
ncbi:MAG: tRNA threonylcarbamoyladenosine dehydratase [bacterium]|nr:tRNA threonylcarbamoyladenosine dehydratase [bacterium]